MYYHDEAGNLRRMPAQWTSLASADAFVAIAAGRSSLRVEDLLKLIALIEQQLGKRTKYQGKRVSSK